MENEINPTTQVGENKQVSTPDNVSPKSRLAALLLGIFLGCFGVHNFYLGRIVRGVFQALLSVGGYVFYFLFLFGIIISGMTYSSSPSPAVALIPFVVILFVMLIMASYIWALVEWILIACGKACDKEGRPVLIWTK